MIERRVGKGVAGFYKAIGLRTPPSQVHLVSNGGRAGLVVHTVSPADALVYARSYEGALPFGSRSSNFPRRGHLFVTVSCASQVLAERLRELKLTARRGKVVPEDERLRAATARPKRGLPPLIVYD